MKNTILVAVGCMAALASWGQTDTPKMNIGGTLRSKYEYQTQEKEGRFEVRTARVNVSGRLNDAVTYKAEIDLCDEGKIKMLDAWARLEPWRSLQLTMGQMRVPFTIDAHRSPHQQYFANRSFIAKQVGNVRDVGAMVGYTLHAGFPIVVEAGMYNGSGLTNQKDFWTNHVNFSAKAQLLLPFGLNVVVGTQKVKPDADNIMMYDAGLSYHYRGLVAEAEVLYKHYDNGAFHPVKAFDGFVSYDFPLRRGRVRKISPLLRYDYMSEHSDGNRYLDGVADCQGTLVANDAKRGRLTGGMTLSLDKPFTSDIRLNYEKYFYGHDGVAKPSERDKLVAEFVVKF